VVAGLDQPHARETPRLGMLHYVAHQLRTDTTVLNLRVN